MRSRPSCIFKLLRSGDHIAAWKHCQGKVVFVPFPFFGLVLKDAGRVFETLLICGCDSADDIEIIPKPSVVQALQAVRISQVSLFLRIAHIDQAKPLSVDPAGVVDCLARPFREHENDVQGCRFFCWKEFSCDRPFVENLRSRREILGDEPAGCQSLGRSGSVVQNVEFGIHAIHGIRS